MRIERAETREIAPAYRSTFGEAYGSLRIEKRSHARFIRKNNFGYCTDFRCPMEIRDVTRNRTDIFHRCARASAETRRCEMICLLRSKKAAKKTYLRSQKSHNEAEHEGFATVSGVLLYKSFVRVKSGDFVLSVCLFRATKV